MNRIPQNNPLRILIVEDDIIVASFIRGILETSGYEVAGIAHGIVMAREINATTKVDLALIDIHLEYNENGLDLATEFSEKKIPFMFITAYDDESTLNQALPLNPLGYLLKPFDDRDLKVALRLAEKKLQSAGLDPAQSSRMDLSSVSANSGAQGRKKSNLSNLNTVQLKAQIELLMQHDRLFLDPDLSLGGLAKELDISNHQLSELFNRVIGVGFHPYITRLRIAEAIRLFRLHPDWTTLRIALDSGFNSRTAFYNAFRKIHGVSPEEFRNQSGTSEKS